MWHYKECAHNISDIPVYSTNTFFKFNGFHYQHGALHQSLEFQNLTQKPHQVAALSNFADFPQILKNKCT